MKRITAFTISIVTIAIAELLYYGVTKEETVEKETIEINMVDLLEASKSRFNITEETEEREKREANHGRNCAQKRKKIYKTIARSALIVPESTNAELVYTEPVPTTAPPPPPPATVAETHPPETMAPPTTAPPVETTAAPVSATPVYSVNGDVLDESLQAFLYAELSKHGIEWWMPYALATAYQESRFNPSAVNPNGLDKGLFQYRSTYYPGSNIFDPREQIVIYCQQTANRLHSGCGIEDTISRHIASDYGAYNAGYVALVLGWVNVTVRIK